MIDVITPSTFQERVLSVPEDFDLFLGGGRGSSKSWTAAFIILSHLVRYGSRARVLYIRKSVPGIADFAGVARTVFKAAYDKDVSYNAADLRFHFNDGATVWLRPLDDPSTYDVLQGQSFALIVCDEAGQYVTFNLVEKVRSNLRGPIGMPLRMVYIANPGGPAHVYLTNRFATARPWSPTTDPIAGTSFVSCPSTYRDNPHIDQERYRQQIIASTNGNAELQAAWLDGSWDAITAGCFFASCFSLKRSLVHLHPRNLTQNWSHSSPATSWAPFISIDHGAAAPLSCGLYIKSPGGPLWDANKTFMPRGSYIRLDEWNTARDDMVTAHNVGIPRAVEQIKRMCDAWGIKRPKGCLDDACFSNQRGGQAASIADEYRAEGLNLTRARKGTRISGWQRMSTFLSDAGSPGRPGLYLNDLCKYALATLPVLMRDERDIEDVDSDGPDHAADEIRYALLWKRPVFGSGTTSGGM